MPLISHAETFTVNSPNGDEISVEHFPAMGKNLFIWIPHESSPTAVDKQLSQQVAKLGIEVWLVDLFNTNFLPVAASSMEKIPASQISLLIDSAYQKTGKNIFLLTAGRGAVPVLRGTRHWQLNKLHPFELSGVIMVGPKLFVETPDPGLEGKLLPIVTASNLPLYILQPAQSPWFWKLPTLVKGLEQSGSDAFIQRLDNIRDRFFFRPDAVSKEHEATKALPKLLQQASQLLLQLPNKTRKAVTKSLASPSVREGKKDLKLQVYKGNPIPPPLALNDLSDNKLDIKDLQGQVVLVNFWASWCPPCVHEMPSMARLMNRFKRQGFTILAVNMAEDKRTIHHFINNRVKINFPVIMDKDGTALRQWKVFAFPTSYLLDRHGVIRFAVFGSIDWDSSEIVSTISELIAEK
ncbi:MAG: TlpA family protein disulfide reductase [Gammaproteobacteria bacterium]|nr:TlpA family protein disulfide reductase [Gammaproteobacteria bacterium]